MKKSFTPDLRTCYAAALTLLLLIGSLAWNLSTTYFIDDLNYTLVTAPGNFEFWHCKGEPLTSLAQLPESIANHYRYVNGRLTNIVHICFQVLPREVECAVNSVLLTAVFVLLLASATPARSRMPSLTASTVVLLLFGLALPWYDGMQSADFLLNYIWPTFGVLIFLRLWPGIAAMGQRAFAAFAVFAFLLAWMHEGFTCPLIALVFFEIVLTPGRRRSRRAWAILAILCIGLLVCVSSGTISRVDDYLFYTSAGLITRLLTRYLSSMWPLWLAIVAVVVCRGLVGREEFRREWVHFAALFAAALVSCAMAVLLIVLDRGLWVADLMAVVICLRCMALYAAKPTAWPHRERCPRSRGARACATILAALVVVLTAWWFAELVRWQRRLTAEQEAIASELLAYGGRSTVAYTAYTDADRIPFYLMRIPAHGFDNALNNTFTTSFYSNYDSAFIAVLPSHYRPEAADSVDAFHRLPPLNAAGTVRGCWPFVMSQKPGVGEIKVDMAEIDGSVTPIDRLIIASRHGSPARRHSYYLWVFSYPVHFPDGTVAYMHLPYFRPRSSYGRRVLGVDVCADE